MTFRGDDRETVAGPVEPGPGEDALAAGTELPGHVVEGVLGSGAMGVVYRARQTALDRIVALKTVKLGRHDPETTTARFLREAKAVARLRHPNIVTAYDCGRHGDLVYYTMELLDGETLDQRLAGGPAGDEAFVWQVIRQAAAGLSHAAAAGVVHRDVKPGNLFLTPPPTGYPLPPGVPMVKVTDFGLAVVHGPTDHDVRLTQSGLVVGTPLYMAPEQFGGAAADLRADIYALGVTAYEMLTGKSPFGSGSLLDLVKAKSAGSVEAATGVSARSLAFVQAMTASDPADRPQTYDELIARIDALLAGDVPQTKPSKPPKPAGRVWRLGGAAAVVLAAGAALAVWLAQPGPSQPPPTEDAGPPVELFRPTEFGSWKTIDGLWKPDVNAEKSSVLTGRGTIRRPIPVEGDYRLTVGVDRHKASAVELHFAIQPPGESRLVLRLTAAGVQVGRRASDDGAFEPETPLVPVSTDGDDGEPQFATLEVERVDGRWYARCNKTWLGGWSDAGPPKLPEFRLRAEGGTAHFEGVEVTPLESK